ncbi:MAG: hypothetical protein R6U19_08785, partial [Bacteroidales bacterium]
TEEEREQAKEMKNQMEKMEEQMEDMPESQKKMIKRRMAKANSFLMEGEMSNTTTINGIEVNAGLSDELFEGSEL